MRFYTTLGVLTGLLGWAGCGGNDIQCGDGTVQQGGSCIVADAGSMNGGSNAASGGKGGTGAKGGSGGGVSCGDGTVAVDGKCVPADAGTASLAKAIGSACASNDDCQSGTCAPAADNLPGGLCTILGCSMDNPCPVGSTCYALNKSLSLCMPYCDRDTACRSDENYHCQPLYSTSVNICAPSCTLTKSCTAGTRCNADSGLCELAECDVSNPGNACTDQETCWVDSKGLSSKGGLCLNLCDPAHPEKTCVVDKNEVCQPLESDPVHKGFCAPPVCTKTSECPAGAECKNSVCQPPALCDSDNHCSDDSTTCVAGKCMPKCPTDSKHCSDIHPSLVCADSLATPACLPLGSFPGSDCRAGACDDVKAGGASVSMVCQDSKCLPDCTSGGQPVCSALSDVLECAHGVFAKDLCLPKGSFPGGGCGANNTCAQDLNGDQNVDMSCVNGTCLISCSEQGKWEGYGDALCSTVDSSLTCATQAGGYCVRSCGDAGHCDTGYSCLDAGAIPAHENSCLPDGTFPGSTCRSDANNQCDQNVGGNDAVDMVCSNNTCVVSCPNNADQLCQGVNPALTCAESAGNICVYACAQGTGACPSGYTCLDPGSTGHQNACLPNGTFPGSPCRSDANNQCDQNVGGNDAVDMVCVAGTCTVSCPSNNDQLCGAVDNRLTCAESAGNICVFACVSGQCPTGYSCLDPGDNTHQNACLPTGSFPSSPCRSDVNNQCDQNVGGNDAVDMVCVAGTCTVSCPSNNDALCQGVDSHLTCSESAGNVCVLACTAGQCPTGYSCLDPGGQNACLPNGTFPGSSCRSQGGNQCDQNLGGNSAVDMVCVNSVCTVSCPSNNDSLCMGVDSHLTCSESAGNLCVLACTAGQCPSGYSCLDPGGQNACLPNGTFPGSTCRSEGGNECDQNVGGNSAVDMVCVNSVCAVSCPSNNDALCHAVDSHLTCSESAGNLCVVACVSGQCASGYSCLDAGDSSHQNACLPTGSFPGSPCRSDVNNQCDQNVGGNSAVDMTCVQNLCVVECPGDNDALCMAVNGALTCAAIANNLCVPACVSNQCPTGLVCYGPENACVPGP